MDAVTAVPAAACHEPAVAELLIEIGFEEMPAPWLPGLAEQLRTRFVDAAAREFLEAKDASVAWTPRRLVLRADLPARQADREEPVWGPALKVAKDAAGAWTPAAQGFAKKNGVAVEELLQRAQGRGEARRAQPAVRAARSRAAPRASSCQACWRVCCARSRSRSA